MNLSTLVIGNQSVYQHDAVEKAF